jgi:hypothetical protein
VLKSEFILQKDSGEAFLFTVALAKAEAKWGLGGFSLNFLFSFLLFDKMNFDPIGFASLAQWQSTCFVNIRQQFDSVGRL